MMKLCHLPHINENRKDMYDPFLNKEGLACFCENIF